MANAAVTARFNESKHQMTSQDTDDATPITDISGTRFGLMFKTVNTSVGKVPLKSFFNDVIDYVRDHNILDQIAAGAFGPTGNILIHSTLDGIITTQVVANGTWWLSAPEASVTVAIPLEAGWSRDDTSTLYLDTIAKRTFEKMRESYLVRV